MAVAYFLTFSTYGTWLHGTAKGRGSVDAEHAAFGAPLLPPDPAREEAARDAMTQRPYSLGPVERDIVCRAMVELARDRGWTLHAVHVRTNHVHVVVSADREPGRLLADLKALASRDLTSAGRDDAERRRWTRHGSTRHLFRDEDVEPTVRYVLDEQGERMAWYAPPKT